MHRTRNDENVEQPASVRATLTMFEMAQSFALLRESKTVASEDLKEAAKVALRGRARLVIINQGETTMDSRCHLRFEEDIAEVLPRAVDGFKKLMKKA